MAHGKGISLFLIDGVPDGRIACELLNWTGKAYKIPRNLLKMSGDRDELHKAGVYLLFGRGPESGELDVAYVGEAEDVYARLAQHQSEDYWSETLVFVSKDENLNKAHVKILEYSIYAEAKEADRVNLKNGNTPNCPAISELEHAVMAEFFDNLKILVGTLGYKLFEPLTGPSVDASDEYYIKAARGANARAVITAEGLVVTEGSEAASSCAPSIPEHIENIRTKLLGGTVLKQEDGLIVFKKSHLFSSPSTAASVVMGRSANGLVEWKDSAGNTLKDNEG